jgi:hypothetical protein
VSLMVVKHHVHILSAPIMKSTVIEQYLKYISASENFSLVLISQIGKPAPNVRSAASHGEAILLASHQSLPLPPQLESHQLRALTIRNRPYAY